jgi:hypothetical protein
VDIEQPEPMVISIDTRSEFLEFVKSSIAEIGIVRTRQFLISEGEHPTFVKMIIRRAVRGYNYWR